MVSKKGFKKITYFDLNIFLKKSLDEKQIWDEG